ncbi:NYN domain-containing protein [Frateuria sp. MAH-13]|uniref:NYN domain-containing protein n=1 Tax=Frateuria flava TaxID=2821489 RepID=A0ABS4DK88_9GAMM|nr:NYN domain-containing protein [Frateuria flava]MBP1473466.1 NYN domain-containing protein [Frateuria flava]
MADHAKLAVLIDADNAQPGLAEGLLAEVARYGTAHVKRAYGDWTDNHLRGWKDQLLDLSIQPIQQFGYTKGKNATDSAMIIDAMDLLYTGRFDGFCIVSSDSDFTRLAARIRESGLTVYGFGERKTPAPFVAACDRFIYTDVLGKPDSDNEKPAELAPRMKTQELRKDTRLVNLLRNAIEDAADDTGWAGLGAVGSMVSKRAPEFDSRNWGYGKLSGLIAAIGLFETEDRQHGNGKHIYVRNNKKKPAARE